MTATARLLLVRRGERPGPDVAVSSSCTAGHDVSGLRIHEAPWPPSRSLCCARRSDAEATLMPPAAGRSWPSGSAGRSARLWVSLGVGYALPQDGEGDTSGRQYGPAPRCLGRNVGPAHVQHVGRCAATDSEVYAHREIAEPWARHVHTAAASGNPGRPAWPSGRPVPGGAPEGALRSGQDPEAGPGFLAVGCISRGWDALCPSTGHILGGV